MNAKLTAYALNELPPDERAALEALMKNNPALREQAEEMKAFCSMLTHEVRQGDTEELTSEQRQCVMRAFDAKPASANIIRPFWRHPIFLSTTALAACVTIMMVKQLNQGPSVEFDQVANNGRDDSHKVDIASGKTFSAAKASADADGLPKRKQAPQPAAPASVLSAEVAKLDATPKMSTLRDSKSVDSPQAGPSKSMKVSSDPASLFALTDLTKHDGTMTFDNDTNIAGEQKGNKSGPMLWSASPSVKDLLTTDSGKLGDVSTKSGTVVLAGSSTFAGGLSPTEESLLRQDSSGIGYLALEKYSEVQLQKNTLAMTNTGADDSNGRRMREMEVARDKAAAAPSADSGTGALPKDSATKLSLSGAAPMLNTIASASTLAPGSNSIELAKAPDAQRKELAPAEARPMDQPSPFAASAPAIKSAKSPATVAEPPATPALAMRGTIAAGGSGAVRPATELQSLKAPPTVEKTMQESSKLAANGILIPSPSTKPTNAAPVAGSPAQPLTLTGGLIANPADPRPTLAATSERFALKSDPSGNRSRLGESERRDESDLRKAPEKDRAPTDDSLVASRSKPTTASYRPIIENPFTYVAQEPLSTFSTDVDSASYANVRRMLNHGERPPADAVRLEELINYFPYSYEPPHEDKPFAVQVDLAEAPWQPLHRLARIALKGRIIKSEVRSAANFVFLLDVSGSMSPSERLPLIKQSLRLLVEQLREDDRVAIVTYAGQSGVALESTAGSHKERILQVIDNLNAGGSTNGASGINLAYEQAAAHFKKGGVNRVILCTDGDFNVGISSVADLEKLITEKAKSGVFLSVLGVGTDNLQDHTMQTLANKGNGNHHYLDSLGEARKVLVEQMTGTLITIAKDVKIQVEFNPAQVSAYRLIGYEKRMLAKQDFNNDRKDAGEIGAGHTVTALYEIVPGSLKFPDGKPVVDDLKYAPKLVEADGDKPAIRNPQSAMETMTVKLRYKAPDSGKSTLMEVPVTDKGLKLAASPQDFQFAVSVAGFGMLLRDSQQRGELTWDAVRDLARKGKGEDPLGYRGEFLQLIDKARGICGQ